MRFNRDIRPILSDNCFLCHGPDATTRKADLRLDSEQGLRASLGDRHVTVPGAPDQSALYLRVRAKDPDEIMPPPESEKSLSADEMGLLEKWIRQGARYEGHWAYAAPMRVNPPRGDEEEWIRNDIDRFILASLAEKKVKPSVMAEKRVLVRRVALDLTGLPPSSDWVSEFLERQDSDAYEWLVDQLLDSAHFGERMANLWLDLVRYADTVGYHGDQPYSVWPYRDYVIRSFNENKPFDEFTIEQIAGDLIPGATREQLIASGYNRLNMITAEGGAQDKEYLAKYASDRVRTTAVTWMAATLGCAECHDHKYDPYTTRDFYSFAAFFADLKEKGFYGNAHATGEWGPRLFLASPEQERERERLVREIRITQENLNTATGEERESIRKALAQLREAKKDLEKSIPSSLVSESVSPRTVRILPRGDWMDESGEVVQPAVPAFLGGAHPAAEGRLTRMDLAGWLVSRDNPLTARVFVNRLWKMLFGSGISNVMNDMGSQGEWPSHPELLDWLAWQFMDSGWNVKYMIKLMVMSNTYRQSSHPRTDLAERDYYNRWYARQSGVRLEAEWVRDQVLALSGLLVSKVGGPSVKPYQPAGYYAQLNFPKREYQADQGENQYRRGVYTHWQRTFLHPALRAFDAPSREECTASRPISNTPLQALVLLNDPTQVEAARVFAGRMIREGGSGPEARIRWAFRHVLIRDPLEEELNSLQRLYQRHREQYEEESEEALQVQTVGIHAAETELDPADLAATVSVARVLFNLHETITRY